jgi:ribonuclease R
VTSSHLAEIGPAGSLLDLADGTGLDAPPPPGAPIGTVVGVAFDDAGPARVEVLAAAGSARAALYRLIGSRGLHLDHPTAVMDEVMHWRAAPGIDDPTLVDQCALPYVTVDGPETRDLDQALQVERDAEGGFLVRYAIADAGWFVRPGTALFDEALRRGATYYLPGISVPMLPRALSEGLVSLNPAVDRRAMVFEMKVDAAGECVATQIVRARIHSRAKLSFDRVQALLDGESGHGIDDADVAESLRALRDMGELRIRRATERGVVPHRNAEVRIELADHEGLDFVVFAQPRNAVERYSEQLSLMCNVEGARVLREAASSPAVQAIYRTHDAPDPARLAELAALIEGVADAHGLGDDYRWHPERQSLAGFLHDLPSSRITHALARQAILVNVRSAFSSEPGPHFGIGADAYARFSAPMREIVGVFVHKEMWDRGHGDVDSDDEATRTRVIERANAARELQRELTREANRLVLDRLFEADLRRPPEDRPVREGTVMGLGRGRIYVQLDAPPVDVKVYAAALDPTASVAGAGARLTGEHLRVSVGDEVAVRLVERDATGRWQLELV